MQRDEPIGVEICTPKICQLYLVATDLATIPGVIGVFSGV